MEETFNKAKENLKKKDTRSLVEIDIKLHELIIKNCGNSQIEKIIDKFQNLVNFYRFADQHDINRARELYFEHYEIFKSIRNRDI